VRSCPLLQDVYATQLQFEVCAEKFSRGPLFWKNASLIYSGRKQDVFELFQLAWIEHPQAK
jgi:hypothetical protein